MNSNAINVAVGLLLPAAIVGLGPPSRQGTLIAVWYLALTAFSLTCAYLGRGLLRGHGVLIICGYLAFAGVVLAVAYASRRGLVLSIAIPAACGIPLAGWLLHNAHGRIRAGEPTEGREATRDQPLDQATRATMPPPHG